MSTLEPDLSRSRQQPEETNQRRLTGWQRPTRWVLRLAFLGAVVLPQARVFCQENSARLKSILSAEFFAALLARRGFEVDAATGGSTFAAGRK